MPQRKPVLHARDHLPGGADPLPGFYEAETAEPPTTQIPSESEKYGDEPFWWYRFREPDYDYPSLLFTPEVSAGEATENMQFSIPPPVGMGAEDPGLTERQPGPNAESVSVLRENVPLGGGFVFGEEWRGTVAITRASVQVGAGGNFTLAGWFKFLDLKNYNVFSITTGVVGAFKFTVLMLNADGSVTLRRHTNYFTSAAGLIQPGVWAYIAITLDKGRLRVYVNPGPAAPTGYDPQLGTEFPFDGPMGMDTWGLANGDYTAAELATRLLDNGFRTAIVQLNASYGPGHAAYITKLTADVATLKAAGLQVVGWGEVDGTTGADLTTTGVDGWMPQIEGDGQRLAVISALGAGVGAGLPKAVVATSGGLDTPAKVADLIAAGIDSAAVEVYAELGAYPYANVDVMLNSFENNGFNAQHLIPMLGTYRGETPDSYVGLDEDYLPNYGIYNVPQTSDAAWQAFAELNQGVVMLSSPVIDVADPMTSAGTGVFSVGYPNSGSGDYAADGTFEGYVSEVTIYSHAISSTDARDQYLSGKYGDTGQVPPHEQVPPGAITPTQLAPGADGQHLVTAGGVASWADETAGTFDLVYNGLFVAGTEYTDGDIVWFDGQLWLCVQPTTSAPSGWPI